MEFKPMAEWFDEAAEMKRFVKALGKCRTCGHAMMAHPTKLKRNICLEATLSNKEVYKQCDCNLFIPTDNLEFLEWAAERKEKNK
jgi:hypothetical protein